MGDRNRENRYNTYQRHLNDTEEFTYPLITKALEPVSGLRFKIFNLTYVLRASVIRRQSDENEF